MQIKINIKKSNLLILMAFLLVSFGIGYVIAYGGTLPASKLGHTWNETDLPPAGIAWTGLHADLTQLTCSTVAGGLIEYNSYAQCSVGYTLMSGGCNNFDGCPGEKSIPSPATNSWNCTVSGTPPSGSSHRVAAYALCCK